MVTNVLIIVKTNADIVIATERKPIKSKDNFTTLFNMVKIMLTTREKINLSCTNIYEANTEVGKVIAIERTDINISFLAISNSLSVISLPKTTLVITLIATQIFSLAFDIFYLHGAITSSPIFR